VGGERVEEGEVRPAPLQATLDWMLDGGQRCEGGQCADREAPPPERGEGADGRSDAGQALVSAPLGRQPEVIREDGSSRRCFTMNPTARETACVLQLFRLSSRKQKIMRSEGGSFAGMFRMYKSDKFSLAVILKSSKRIRLKMPAGRCRMSSRQKQRSLRGASPPGSRFGVCT
jgi:hypothetical protein